ncbi:hypothetical protein [Kineothrix sedimenti]|uniref:Chorion class high-cysteine HCB protein 13 n=1 Tax=Kineothrix sedimenti TaxID=3123317 RepID=A0ABZ3ESQ7_9FIRM
MSDLTATCGPNRGCDCNRRCDRCNDFGIDSSCLILILLLCCCGGCGFGGFGGFGGKNKCDCC